MPDADFTCPNCGAEVPARAQACPACGSDENTGWSEQALYGGTPLEEPAKFDYEAWRRRELGGRPPRPGIGWLWWLVAILMLVLFLWLFVGQRIREAL